MYLKHDFQVKIIYTMYIILKSNHAQSVQLKSDNIFCSAKLTNIIIQR